MKTNVKPVRNTNFFIFITIYCFLCLPSCSTISKIDRTGMDSYIEDTNYYKMNGKYYNMGTNLSGPVSVSVYNMFYAYKTFHKKINNHNLTVNIKSVNEKKIELSFLQGDSILKKKILRGKFKNGYFSVNTSYSFLNPFFPLLWGPANCKRLIGITKNNDLVILDTRNAIVLFLVIPFWGAGGDSYNEFMRLE